MFVLVINSLNCKHNVTGPSPSPPITGNYQLCYDGYGKIKTNNISGSNPQVVSIDSISGQQDQTPQWSPDGRYIVYQSLIPGIGNPFVFVYDLQKGTHTNLTSDGGIASSFPHWTPNGKIYFSYQRPALSPAAMYIMNPDGTNKIKISDDSAAVIYFYSDSYTFLSVRGSAIYKTNLDGSLNELVLQLPPPGATQFINVGDFNPFTGELLVNTNTVQGLSSAIATFNAETKQMNLIFADSGFLLAGERYSKDYSKIVFCELNAMTKSDEFLCILENGTNRRLVELKGGAGSEWFDFNPMEFSPDNKLVAYAKNVTHGVTWTSYLYVVEISTGTTQYIDKGFYVSWNPAR